MVIIERLDKVLQTTFSVVNLNQNVDRHAKSSYQKTTEVLMHICTYNTFLALRHDVTTLHSFQG